MSRTLAAAYAVGASARTVEYAENPSNGDRTHPVGRIPFGRGQGLCDFSLSGGSGTAAQYPMLG